MSITIKQIAEYTNTSRGTVDKVLHNRPGVNENTRKKVLAAIEELNYSPNFIGKALVLNNKPIKIGIIVTPDYNYYIQEVIRGINSASEEYTPLGISVDTRILASVDPKEEIQLLDQLYESGCKGIAVFPIDDEEVKAKINQLCDKGIAIVTFNSQVEGIGGLCFIGQNNYRAGRTVGSLLKRILPHNGKVAVIISTNLLTGHELRYRGMVDKLSESNLNTQIVDIAEAYDDEDICYVQTKRICSNHSDLNAIYITGGGVMGVCRALEDIGLADSVKVITHDIKPQAFPKMRAGTIAFSIEQDGPGQGSLLVKTLFEYLVKHQSPHQFFLEAPTVIVTEELL